MLASQRIEKNQATASPGANHKPLEDLTMTDDMMNLRALLEKSSDAELLREMVGFAT